jgi:uncharacterized protein YdeI (BOF family)
MNQQLFLPLAIVTSISALAVPQLTQAEVNQSQTQITRIADLQRPRSITISGRVRSMAGNDFVLEDGTGQIIVHSGPRRWREVNLTPGEQVTITGELSKSGKFDAFSIRRANGSVIEIRSPEGPPPWAGNPNRPKPKAKS